MSTRFARSSAKVRGRISLLSPTRSAGGCARSPTNFWPTRTATGPTISTASWSRRSCRTTRRSSRRDPELGGAPLLVLRLVLPVQVLLRLVLRRLVFHLDLLARDQLLAE